MTKIKCCICGKEVEQFGNNPYPLCDKDDYDSRCCNECDQDKVIPARIMMHYRGLSDKAVQELFLGKIVSK